MIDWLEEWQEPKKSSLKPVLYVGGGILCFVFAAMVGHYVGDGFRSDVNSVSPSSTKNSVQGVTAIDARIPVANAATIPENNIISSTKGSKGRLAVGGGKIMERHPDMVGVTHSSITYGDDHRETTVAAKDDMLLLKNSSGSGKIITTRHPGVRGIVASLAARPIYIESKQNFSNNVSTKKEGLPLNKTIVTRNNSNIPLSSGIESVSLLSGESIITPTALEVSSESSKANDKLCLAKAIYFEARSESRRGQMAIANVIMNRVKDKDYPNSICGVVYQNHERRNSCQFSFACDGRTDTPRPGKAWNRAKEIAALYNGGRITGIVGKATHYHADYVKPGWARSMVYIDKVGNHIFYRREQEKVRVKSVASYKSRYSNSSRKSNTPPSSSRNNLRPKSKEIIVKKASAVSSAAPVPKVAPVKVRRRFRRIPISELK